MTAIENKKLNNTVSAPESNEEIVTPLKKQPSYLQWGIAGSVLLLVVLLGMYLFKKSSAPPQSLNKTTPSIQQPVLQRAQPTNPRSKAPGIVVNVVSAKGTNPKTGEALNPTSTFSTTDKSIFVVTTLQNAKKGTKIEYARYLNNKFLDNRSITILKPNTNNTSFIWTLKKSGATHPVGNYRVKIYTDGIFEKETSYIVQ